MSYQKAKLSPWLDVQYLNFETDANFRTIY